MNSQRLFIDKTVAAFGILFILFIYMLPVAAEPIKKQKPVASVAANWSFKRKITVENNGDKASDAVVQIQFDKEGFDYTKAKSDGADIRFSTKSKEPTDSGLSYWIEQWNDSGRSRIWVKMPVLKSHSATTIYMYYGNADASSVSNGHATFLFFDDFEAGDYTKKWNNVSVGQVVEQDGMLKLKETDGEDGIITANFMVTGKMMVRTRYQRERGDEHWTRAGIGGWNNWLCFGDHTDFAGTGTNYVMLYDSASLSSLKTAPLVKAANKVITGKWRRAAYWYDGHVLKGAQDDVTVEWPSANASSKLGLRTLDNDSWDNFAFITVSAYLTSEPTVIIGQQKNN